MLAPMKAKFKAGDFIYFKYPSRYSRRNHPGTYEAILKIKSVYPSPEGGYDYDIELIKCMSGDETFPSEIIISEAIYIDTYSRKLTPTERVLYE